MATVGIIANPASGKDIRRLVAHGSVFDNQEKVNILRRVLLGLQATGVEQVIFMPDYFGIGAKAKVREIVLTRAEPSNIGLSSIGGCFYPSSLDEEHGIHIKVGRKGQGVLAPIAPGLIVRVGIESCDLINLNEAVEVIHKPSVLALDGEREVEVGRKDRIFIRLTRDGPWLIDIKEALKEAAQNGFFMNRVLEG